jgi:uncharacterized membrane protein YeaQ/YmgE (transglycosylase-associated protein family)
MSADLVLSILFLGIMIGALARLAVPGPDPMPLWLTLAIGLSGSIVGAVVARGLFRDSEFVSSFGSLTVAIALVVAYRRFVQHRPVWGRDALRFPKSGFGVERYRARLKQVGIDPDTTLTRVPPDPPDPSQRLLAMLDDLHREGLLDDEELAAKRELVEARRRRAST